MGDGGPSYSALSANEQAAVSVWIEGFEGRFSSHGSAALEQTLQEAPERLRVALLSQLLPLAIDAYRQQHGVTPTLHELRLAHPNLSSQLNQAYPHLPEPYRLPVELHGYRVIRVVGEGGQAVVLRAQDDVHSTVAIKLSTSPRHNELLLRERRILGECNHPAIVSVIGSGMHEDRAYFVMPFLRGVTLADKYASFRPDASEATRVIAELCGAVEHLHRHGVLHRDIKPANVWVDDQGGVKLIDLGMAIERSRWGEPLSEIREFHGTPAFMSPEQAASDGRRDGELSDVFSIGATLYWLGTGSPPFDGGSGESVLHKASLGQFDRDRLETIAQWPKRLSRACLKAMAVDQQQRYRSAGELADAMVTSAAEDPGTSRRAVVLLLIVLLAGLGYAGLEGYPETFWRSLNQSAEAEPIPVDDPANPITAEEASGEPPAKESSPAKENPSSGEPDEAPASDESQAKPAEQPSADQPPPAPPGMEYIKMGVGPYLPNHPEGGRSEWVLREKAPDAQAMAPLSPEPVEPKLSQAERVAKAKAWLKSLPDGTQLGQFVGRRFHPTTLAPIKDAITSIRITTGKERYGPRTILLGDKPDEFWDVPPERIRDNLLRPLRETDSWEYAYDSECSAVAEPVKAPFIEMPPGENDIDLTVYFLDGSFIDHQLVGNLDKGIAIDISSNHPLTPHARLFLYREKSIGPDSIATYLKEPLSPSDPNRDYLLRTRVGFYCPVIPRYPLRAASTNVETVKPPDRIVPGTYYVHHFTSAGERTRVNRYEVTREKLVELAELAAYFERELRTQYFNADGSRREGK